VDAVLPDRPLDGLPLARILDAMRAESRAARFARLGELPAGASAATSMIDGFRTFRHSLLSAGQRDTVARPDGDGKEWRHGRGNAVPYALAAGEGWTYHYGIDFTLKARELAGRPRLAFMEYTTRIGEEPPDHVHATEDEIFYVLQGSLIFRCGGRAFPLRDGGFIFLPRGIEHGYQITSAGDVRLLVVTSPAPEGVAAGWGGFAADLERDGELRAAPAGMDGGESQDGGEP